MSSTVQNDLDNVKRSLKYLRNNVELVQANSRIVDCLNHMEVNIQYLEQSINELKLITENINA